MKHILLVWSGDMKLNNKGITLVEIIISIALISIVLLFLFSLLVTVNDMNNESKVNTTYLITKSLILKNIEDDINSKEITNLNGVCDIPDFYTDYNKTSDYFKHKDDTSINEKLKAKECKSFVFGDGTKAYLAIYYYKPQNSYVISYIHGSVKATRELPDFEKYNVEAGIIKHGMTYGSRVVGTSTFYKIEIPIIGSDGKDYSIIVSYKK